MLKTIGTELWARVFKAYASTLVGLALVAADVVISNLQTAPLPTWAHAVVGVIAAILALYKGKQATPSLPPA